MDYVIAVIACIGAWLLFAGPVYQAAIELQEQDLDREQFAMATSAVPPREKVSAWWWLLPPVAWWKRRKSAAVYQRAMLAALGPQQLEQTVSFFNKANGWMIVAAGAFLLAINETWLLVRLLEWPVWVLWVTVVVLGIACLANAALTTVRNERLLKSEEELAALHAQRSRARRKGGKPSATSGD